MYFSLNWTILSKIFDLSGLKKSQRPIFFWPFIVYNTIQTTKTSNQIDDRYFIFYNVMGIFLWHRRVKSFNGRNNDTAILFHIELNSYIFGGLTFATANIIRPFSLYFVQEIFFSQKTQIVDVIARPGI